MSKREISKWLMRIVTVILSVFIVIVGIVCLKGLIESIDSFVKNQQTFSKAYSDAAAEIAKLPFDKANEAQVAIDHLERLQQIQKNASTNDVMSFLYSVLSTVLIGVCAGFVAKAHANASESKDSALKSKECADNASNYATEATNSASVASDYLETAKKEVGNAKATYERAAIEIGKTKDTVDVLSIHIEIVHARASLFSYNKIEANKRVFLIMQMVLRLTKNINNGMVTQLQQELLSLETAIDNYRQYAEAQINESEKTSMLQAAQRYMAQVNDAIEHCDKILKQ